LWNISLSTRSFSLSVEKEDRVYFMPYFLPFEKAGGLQILRCQGLAVDFYGFALDALTLEPSDFFSDGVKKSPGSHVFKLRTAVLP
jgi:hypothetical protein